MPQMDASSGKVMRIKIISMGNSEVGKVRWGGTREQSSPFFFESSPATFFQSCLIKRYCERRFVAKYLPTIGIDYGVTK